MNLQGGEMDEVPKTGGKPWVAAEGHAPTLLWLIRHAEVEASFQNVFGGRIDMSLSPRGEEQALALSQYLKGKQFTALYASPMKRVRQTLEPVLTNGAPQPRFVEGLREVDFGCWTGLSWEEVFQKHGVSPYEWLDQLECGSIEGAECAADFRARVAPCIQEILHAHPGQQVGVVCHGGVIRMILSILLELPLPSLGNMQVEYASITQVSWAPGRIRLELLNFTPWRDRPIVMQ
jgi:broad specificity phosphatase PhoE